MAFNSGWGGPLGFLLEFAGGLVCWLTVGWFRRSLKAELASEDNKLRHAIIGAIVVLGLILWLIPRTGTGDVS